MITPKQETAFMSAMTKRLNWYEDMMKAKLPIKEYVNRNSCLIYFSFVNCHNCPLEREYIPCGTTEREDALDAIDTHSKISKKKKITIIKKHYNDLIKRIKEKGYTYK